MKIVSPVVRILWFTFFFFFPIFLLQKPYAIFRLQGTGYSEKGIFSMGMGPHCGHQDHWFVLISLPVDATGIFSLSSLSKSLKQVLFSTVVLFLGNCSVLRLILASDKTSFSSWTQTAAQGGQGILNPESQTLLQNPYIFS